MPFDFKAYDQKCQGLTLEELQREWEHYTRLISGAATSTAVSGCAIPLTLGISTIGVAMAAPAIHNARKKREIIERHLNRLNATHHTRKRDVLGSRAVSGTIGVVTLGVGSMGADAVATAGAEHGIQSIIANETAIKIVSHAALDGAGMAIEHAHTDHLKKKDAKKAFQKAGVFQAVQDAKAAEAGYSIQPYPNNGQYPVYAAIGSSQALPLPPPPYNAAVGQTISQLAYTPSPNIFPQDSKNPTVSHATTQQNGYLVPNMTGQQPPQQLYDYKQHQQVPVSGAPSPMPSVNTSTFSPPQTPATQYSTQQHAPYQHQGGNSPYMPTPQAFDLTALQQALPTATASPATHTQPTQQYTPLSPPPDNSQSYQVQPTPQYYPAQIPQAPQAGYFPPPPVTPSGYPPAVTVPHHSTLLPVSVPQVPQPIEPSSAIQSPMQHYTEYQPNTLAYQPQNQRSPGYPTLYQNQPYHHSQAPTAVDINRRDSVLQSPVPFAPQPYNPQHYGPISQKEKTDSVLIPSFSNTHTPAPQTDSTSMHYQMPPTPLPTGSNAFQYQYDNKGSYFPTQPQTPQGTGYPLAPAQV